MTLQWALTVIGLTTIITQSKLLHPSDGYSVYNKHIFTYKHSGLGETSKMVAKIVRTCNICGLTGSGNNMLRYHFKNCGIKQKSPILTEKTCPHCGLCGKGPNMTRYHFNNCKKKHNDDL
jgi:hypothetical protein